MLLVVRWLRLSLLSHSVLPVTLMVNWRPCGPCTTKDWPVAIDADDGGVELVDVGRRSRGCRRR